MNSLSAAIACLLAGFAPAAAAEAGLAAIQRPIADLQPVAKLHLGKTADWVAITREAVWIGGTGPDAVHRIDPGTNREAAVVLLPGEPCAGLAVGSPDRQAAGGLLQSARQRRRHLGDERGGRVGHAGRRGQRRGAG